MPFHSDSAWCRQSGCVRWKGKFSNFMWVGCISLNIFFFICLNQTTLFDLIPNGSLIATIYDPHTKRKRSMKPYFTFLIYAVQHFEMFALHERENWEHMNIGQIASKCSKCKEKLCISSKANECIWKICAKCAHLFQYTFAHRLTECLTIDAASTISHFK